MNEAGAGVGGGADRIAARRAADAGLEAEGRLRLRGVLRFAQVPRRPPGLPALAAALADAAEATGSPVAPERLAALARAAAHLSAGDRSLDDVAEVAARMQVPVRPVTLTGRWWRDPGLPLVARTADGPVALRPGRRAYERRDTAGDWQALDATAEQQVDRAAHVVYPRLPDPPVTTRDLLRLALRGGRLPLVQLAAATAATTVLGGFLPYATARIVGVMVPAGTGDDAGALLAAVAAFVVAMAVAALIQSLALLALGSRAAVRLTAASWDRLLHLPFSFFRGRSSGELAQQITAFDQMRLLVTNSLVVGLTGSALSVSAVVVLLGFDLRSGLLVLATFVVVMLLGTVLVARQSRQLTRVVALRNRLNGLLLGLFDGVAKLRIAGAERRAHALWRAGYARQQEAQRDAAVLGVQLTILQALLGPLLLIAVVGILATQQETATVAIATAAVATSGQLAAAGASILVVAAAFVRLRVLYRSVAPVLQTPLEVSSGAPVPANLRGDVRFEDVRFGYVADDAVLDGVSFHAPAGSFLAIVGPSGAGKSTIIRLLLGFEQPWTGDVSLDDKPIGGLDLEGVRRRIGTLLQGGKVTAGSILTNIVGAHPVGVDAAWKAAELAALADDIRAMPMQMATRVPEGGAGFSGGQLQRLLLARALVRRPAILLLDEATSALDNETQQAVMDNLERARVTRIVVAHRLSTVRHADRIVVLDAGRVVEQGTFDELVVGGGLFAALVSRQLM